MRFDRLLVTLWNIRGCILDVKAMEWHDEYDKFRQGIKDLEIMMQNVIISSFECVNTIESGLELLDIFQHLVKREAIRKTFDKKTADIYQMFIQEINAVKTEFETRRKTPDILRSHPDFSGSAFWAKALLKRLQHFVAAFSAAYYLPIPLLSAEAKFQYEPLIVTLEDYISKTHAEWVLSLKPNLGDKLNDTLMTHVSGRDLEMKFDNDLFSLFGEISNFKKLKWDSPFHINEIYSKKEELRVLRENVLMVVRDYNVIIGTLSAQEALLFKEKIRFLDKKINPGITTLTW